MKIIGLAGPAGTGKDTIADYLVESHGFTKFSFSDGLYAEVAEAFNIDKAKLYDRALKEQPSSDLMLFYCKDHDFRNVMVRMLHAAGHKYPTEVWCSPRQILQWWGTEYRRQQDPEYWIKKAALYVEAWLQHIQHEHPARYHGGLVNCSVRFPNERAFIEGYHGEVWHVQRAGFEQALQAGTAAHVAEQGLEVLGRDKLVVNNGTIEQLHTASVLLLGAPAGARVECGPEPVARRHAPEVTCVKCGWVHVGLSKEEAQAEVEKFNEWYDQQPDATKEMFGGRSSLKNYEGCDRCGGTQFRVAKEGDAPIGCTLGPVIVNGMHSSNGEDGCPND